jgi:DNA-binding transcriptional regulator YdaS (Cro superfamily)
MKIVDQLCAHPAFGSYAAIAAVVGLSREAVRKWKRVPGECCIRIEEHTNGDFSRYGLRPDIFGPPPANDPEGGEVDRAA